MRPVIVEPSTWPLLSAIHAFAALASIEVGLRLLPFHTLFAHLSRRYPAGRRVADLHQPEVRRVVRQVEAASKLIPGSKCLGIALAVKTLLARRGYALRLRIGLARAETGGERSYHAWLESGELVVVGGSESPSVYFPVPISLVRERHPARGVR